MDDNTFNTNTDAQKCTAVQKSTTDLPKTNSHCSFPSDLSGTTSRSSIIIDLLSVQMINEWST